MIAFTLTADEATRSPERGCYWTATAVVEGRSFTGRSRVSPMGELARALVEAGVADAPLCGPGLSCASFHAAAKWTIEESASVALTRRRWRPAFGGEK